MHTRSATLIASTALIVAAALVPAAGATVLGPSTGVTAVRTGSTVDVTFTPGALATSRLKTGRTVSLTCSPKPAAAPLLLDENDDDLTSDSGTAWGEGTVGAGGVAHVKLYANSSNNRTGAADYCEVDRVHHITAHSTVTNAVARVPLTPAGATYVDESARATALRHLIQRAHAATGYQPVAALGAGVVAMDAPDATPPAGQTGYWTDGTHAAVATLSAAGRRLVIEDQGGFVLRTNVLEQMDPYGFDDYDTSAAPSPDRTTTTTKARNPDADRKRSSYRGDPLSPADGIRATVRGRRATVRFTGRAARAFRALRGRRVSVVCLAVPAPTLFPDLVGQALSARAGAGVARVPAHGDAVTATLKGGTGDVCDVIDDMNEIAFAGGTVAGRAWTQDLAALLLLNGADHVDYGTTDGQRYLPTAQLVAAGREQHFVAMSGPDGAPPVGRIGVWSDGARRAALVVVSASGHRFADADEGDGIGRTNILSAISWLYISETFSLATETSTSSGPSGSVSGEFDSK